MVFSQRLARAAQLVESRLAALLDALADAAAPSRLIEAMRLGTLGGGKRLRPFLVIECAALFDVPPERTVATAAAIECVHCYSLIHDDLPAMDNDDLRRGKPTLHRAYDEWTAILAGDALLSAAFELLSSEEAHPGDAVRAALVAGLARASGATGMVGGQCLDLEADKLGLPAAPALDHVRRLQAMKTGALIRFACEAGAILGHAGIEQRRALATYGENLGLAFQISDDLLDVEGHAAHTGKATQKDFRKATFVSVAGIGSARQKLATAESDAIAALASFASRAEVLREAARYITTRTA